MGDLIATANEHLQKVISGAEHVDAQLLNPIAARLNLDTGSLLANQESTISGLLPTVIQTLQTPQEDEDYEPVINLLRAILSKQPFQDVIKYVPIEVFLEGLNSNISSLQHVCIEQARNAKPADLVANTPLVDALLKLGLSDTAESNISYEALETLVELGTTGTLVRRRLLTGESLRSLQEVRNGNDAKLQSRMCDLVQGIYPHDEERLLPKEFVCYEPAKIDQYDDLLFSLQLIGFYKNLFNSEHLPELVETTRDQVKAIINLYSQRDTNSDVRAFFLNHILEFLGTLSRKEPQYFKQLDNEYNITEDYTQATYLNEDSPILFMSLLNPEYLVQKRPESIRNLPYKARTVRALKSLLKNQAAYNISVPTSDKLLSLPYLELMVILTSIASTPWGTNDLLENWPSVMDSLISNEDVRDKDVISYRREVFELLLDNNTQDTLGVWYDGIKNSYKQMLFGTTEYNPGVMIADESGDV
jgi:hypothetical protein